ncbi:hypothetical protein CEXT_197141 [Caerostris extrusa]|uniref:Uncharacterized protein n=1 Tax=Caerostris extrusa TaxID=172846 RepID=A0AAV4QUZ4_CAEEX|nr:hypothetical protein CEXT_197141 [Caerostris extrusa]
MPHRHLVLRIPYSRYTSCYTSSNSRYTPSVSHPPNSQYTSSISRSGILLVIRPLIVDIRHPYLTHLIASIRLQYLVVRPPYSGIQLIIRPSINGKRHRYLMASLITSMPHRYLVLRIPYSRYTSCYTSS